MSPDFVSSVDEVAAAMLSTEYPSQGRVMSPTDKRALPGLVYRFIQRLTVAAVGVASVKESFDATCLTFACRKHLRMFKRVSRLLDADAAVRVDEINI